MQLRNKVGEIDTSEERPRGLTTVDQSPGAYGATGDDPLATVGKRKERTCGDKKPGSAQGPLTVCSRLATLAGSLAHWLWYTGVRRAYAYICRLLTEMQSPMLPWQRKMLLQSFCSRPTDVSQAGIALSSAVATNAHLFPWQQSYHMDAIFGQGASKDTP